MPADLVATRKIKEFRQGVEVMCCLVKLVLNSLVEVVAECGDTENLDIDFQALQSDY